MQVYLPLYATWKSACCHTWCLSKVAFNFGCCLSNVAFKWFCLSKVAFKCGWWWWSGVLLSKESFLVGKTMVPLPWPVVGDPASKVALVCPLWWRSGTVTEAMLYYFMPRGHLNNVRNPFFARVICQQPLCQTQGGRKQSIVGEKIRKNNWFA